MKVNTAVRDVESSGFGQQTTFSIQAGAKAFEILSSTLYTDKVGAVVRETIMNAFDSHIAAKKRDTPIEVHLPTTFEPVFIVRDFGTGMSHDFTMHLYSTYFASSKSNENDSVGGFGLGSKSPFSYVDTFTVTVWQGGEKRQYACFKDSNNCPQISMISNTKSDEPVGVEVRVPVLVKDIQQFSNAYAKAIRWLPTKPNCNNNSALPARAVERPTDKNYTLDTAGYRGEIEIVVGYLGYKLNPDVFKDKIDYTYVKVLTNNSLTLFFNIGDIDIAANRESLSLTPATIKTIGDRIKEIVDTHNDVLQKQIDLAKTRMEAYQLATKALRGVIKDFKWQGKDITDHEGIDITGAVFLDLSSSGSSSFSTAYTLNKDAKGYAWHDCTYVSDFLIDRNANVPVFVFMDQMPGRYNSSAYFKELIIEIRKLSNSYYTRNHRAVYCADANDYVKVEAQIKAIMDNLGCEYKIIYSSSLNLASQTSVKPSKTGTKLLFKIMEPSSGIEQYTYDASNTDLFDSFMKSKKSSPNRFYTVVEKHQNNWELRKKFDRLNGLLKDIYSDHSLVIVTPRNAGILVKKQPEFKSVDEVLKKYIEEFEADTALHALVVAGHGAAVDYDLGVLKSPSNYYSSYASFDPIVEALAEYKNPVKSKTFNYLNTLRGLVNSAAATKYKRYVEVCEHLGVTPMTSLTPKTGKTILARDTISKFCDLKLFAIFDRSAVRTLGIEYIDNLLLKIET